MVFVIKTNSVLCEAGTELLTLSIFKRCSNVGHRGRHLDLREREGRPENSA
jgi:hypothetical protein